MVTPRQGTSGFPILLGQAYAWSADQLDAGSGLASVNNVIAPLAFPVNAYIGNDTEAQAVSNLRILRPAGGTTGGSELINGLVTLHNLSSEGAPSVSGSVIVRMRVGTLEQFAQSFDEEVAKLEILASTIAALTGPGVAPAQQDNWTNAAGAPLAEIPVVGGNQFIAASVDVPASSNLGAINIRVDWLLQ